MGTAQNIRACRIRAGKSAEQIAASLGLNDAWYHDLESNDDELMSTLTLFQAAHLASLLGVGLEDLVTEIEPAGASATLIDVPSRIERYIAEEGMSIEEFENWVGWELQDFLRSPVKVAAEVPMMFLRDVLSPLGINWLALASEEELR